MFTQASFSKKLEVWTLKLQHLGSKLQHLGSMKGLMIKLQCRNCTVQHFKILINSLSES